MTLGHWDFVRGLNDDDDDDDDDDDGDGDDGIILFRYFCVFPSQQSI